jgi:predicted O-linked N-acetylglucosamine transferase (SPINDLY family)
LTFARKPAPIQVTWLGYVGTTGLGAIDYLLSDRHAVPAQAECFYRERLLRMPDSYVCYDPPGAAPAVGPLPALAAGRVTFASFNNPAKIGRELVAIWARILRRVPGSRLLLKYLGLDDPAVGARYLAMFAGEGVERGRVELGGWSAYEAFLPSYHEVDLALDPWPHGGGLTTCEALWMGVPVITCPGETLAGRQSLSYLSAVGLHETIARDADDYVEIAVRLASDLGRLAALRAGLREQVARSALCDGGLFADNLTRLLRDVWRRWCGELRECAERETTR